MKEKENMMEWKHGLFCGGKRFGFGLCFGVFLLAWGAFEMASQFGWIKGMSFPFWPLLLIFIGISMIMHRI
ncbi:MAG: DUF5668 domain-containing protein [Candidatus Micrarchaeota archaeon]